MFIRKRILKEAGNTVRLVWNGHGKGSVTRTHGMADDRIKRRESLSGVLLVGSSQGTPVNAVLACQTIVSDNCVPKASMANPREHGWSRRPWFREDR